MIDTNLIHKALANPLRRDILAWLRTPAEAFPTCDIHLGQGVPAHAIHARSALSQSTVSVHISVLVAAGLLVSMQVGQWTFLSRNEEVIRAFVEQIRQHL
ncbi:ArsR/SmtB family transcription factor [Paraburkholderia sp. ZP32-5]|uniref:ArsR/SmtB family transcription factor n=1 Tax=Paraburkholderia sp. ZP32-5 TaxID=2883245 RepID=UPI001F48CD37|nr:helix-turn-helix transcriptional regulator [Paraburkholderia sp. ZP32-5]